MKKCPYCAEEIQEKAVKCRWCGEFFDGASRKSGRRSLLPWYFRTSWVVVAIGCVGPFALPLVWWHPNWRPATKIVISAIVVVLSWYLYRTTVQSLQNLNELYRTLQQN